MEKDSSFKKALSIGQALLAGMVAFLMAAIFVMTLIRVIIVPFDGALPGSYVNILVALVYVLALLIGVRVFLVELNN